MQTDVKNLLKLSLTDIEVSYDRKNCREIRSPWSPELGNVIKYRVKVKLLQSTLLFDFHDSIAACKSQRRAVVEKVVSYLKRGELKLLRSWLRNGRWPALYIPELKSERDRNVAKDFMEAAAAYRGRGMKMLWPSLKDYIEAAEIGTYPVVPEIEYLDEKGLANAFRSFIQDAAAGNMKLRDFQSAFGYTDAADCIQAYEGCQEAYKKVTEAGLSDDDMSDILEELSKMGIE